MCPRWEVTVDVPADRSLIVSLQRAGVPMKGSCLRGICGSYAVGMIEGTPEHRDSLTGDDASMTIYPCVSRALSPALVINA